ncbi:trophoblast glycoprotein-like [Sinocyclocheilus anshuiensis]|uniref:trophoblast glycoprotein-like n=1 Tax=Sinocyclocheilus anshuiensis TaxID=1608454 RepID=UPI0007B9EB5E|nr:PREDICTED: trophoblast glycoprotein-like [Sinocyclocheilus anshuiensis]
MMPLTLVCTMLCVSACVASCPPRCECSDAPRTVRCASAALHRVPAAIPRDASSLIITGNAIPRLDPSAFSGPQNATLLNLSDNGIIEIGSHAFSSLLALRSLILNNNQLVLIHPEAFSVPGSPLQELSLRASLYNYSSLTDLITALRWGELTNLLRLDLSGNRLVLLSPGMFAPLPNLQHLHLRNNSLVAIYNGTFSGVEQLLELDLTGNAFRTISDEGLRELERLGRVRLLLGQNPYACTCEAQEFANWLNRSKVRVDDVDGLYCEFPASLRGASLRGISAQGLGCYGNVPEEITDLSLQTSYVFLGLVLGFVGMVFLFVVYLNRKGIKKWITDIYEACRDVLEGYHYRYEIDSDPRLGRVSHGQQQSRPRMDPCLAHISTDARITQIPSDVTL